MTQNPFKQFILFNKSDLDLMNEMYQKKIDNSYIIIHQYGDFSTIVQYRSAYDQFKIVNCLTRNLDPKSDFEFYMR